MAGICNTLIVSIKEDGLLVLKIMARYAYRSSPVYKNLMEIDCYKLHAGKIDKQHIVSGGLHG
jgi:hypothetical protein